MYVTKKILFSIFVLFFITCSNIFAHSHGGGGNDGRDVQDANLFNIKYILESGGFSSQPQSEISNDTLNLNTIEPMSAQELAMQMNISESNFWGLVSNVMLAGQYTSQTVVFIAGIGLAVVAGTAATPTIAILTAEQALAIGVGYTVTTSLAQDLQNSDMTNEEALAHTARAGATTFVTGNAFGNSPIAGGVIDQALSYVPNNNSPVACSVKIPDYGPGSQTSRLTGQRDVN